MKAIPLFFFLLLACFSHANEKMFLENISDPSSHIQILIEKDAEQALLEVKGPYTIFNPEDGKKISSGSLGKRFLVHGKKEGIKWGEEFPGIHQIYIKPRSSDTSILINGIQYEGAVAIFQIGNLINITNDLDIETFLKTTLAPQFPYPLDNEVMASVAILARTNAYFLASKNPEKFWHVEADQAFYYGKVFRNLNSLLERAIDSTKDLILVSPNEDKNAPIFTKWTEHSGGKTASYQAIFRKDLHTPISGVIAPHAALDREESHWSYTISSSQLAELFKLPSINHIQLFIDPPSEKVYAIRLNNRDINFFLLQEKLGKEKIKSNDFQVKIEQDKVIFNGYGRGDGVGLCLYSATALAQNGENALKILAKFFPKTMVYNLSDTQMRKEIFLTEKPTITLDSSSEKSS